MKENMKKEEKKDFSVKRENENIEVIPDRYPPYATNSVPGINTPEISPPLYNPPVPNRAWTAMREDIIEENKRLGE